MCGVQFEDKGGPMDLMLMSGFDEATDLLAMANNVRR